MSRDSIKRQEVIWTALPPPFAFCVRATHAPGWGRLTLEGELDLASAPVLQSELDRVERDPASVIVLDLRRLLFMDVAGMRVLLEAHERALRGWWSLVIVRRPRAVQRGSSSPGSSSSSISSTTLVQNHMLQLVALLTMELATTFEANRVRNEKVKVLDAIVPPDIEDVGTMSVRAQYGPGVVGGRPVPGYRQEEGVAPDSSTETYAVIRLHLSNWRWAGVPFYLRTGKHPARKLTSTPIAQYPAGQAEAEALLDHRRRWRRL